MGSSVEVITGSSSGASEIFGKSSVTSIELSDTPSAFTKETSVVPIILNAILANNMYVTTLFFISLLLFKTNYEFLFVHKNHYSTLYLFVKRNFQFFD